MPFLGEGGRPRCLRPAPSRVTYDQGTAADHWWYSSVAERRTDREVALDDQKKKKSRMGRKESFSGFHRAALSGASCQAQIHWKLGVNLLVNGNWPVQVVVVAGLYI